MASFTDLLHPFATYHLVSKPLLLTQEYDGIGVCLSYSWDLFSSRSMTWHDSENKLLPCLGAEPPRSHNRGL